MPIYEVYHSFPLTATERQHLATSITNLHCTAFTTPSFFVHVRFVAQDATDGTYYMAGKPRMENTNRIIGIVRQSPSRKKEDFDRLAVQIEDAWYAALKADDDGSDAKVNGNDAGVDADRYDDLKRLLVVVFTPMIAIREGGMEIPTAGQEGQWLKSQMPFFKEMAEKRGLTDYEDMLAELESREDLKELLKDEK